MSKPITPAEVTKSGNLPDEVIEVFNSLIAEKWHGRTSVVLQKTAAAQVAKKLKIPIQKVYDKHYLDIEGAYERAGWSVRYRKPGFNEDFYEPHFEFSKN